MTDLTQSAYHLSEHYARRMTLKELFHDGKSRRNGFALRNTPVKHADRFRPAALDPDATCLCWGVRNVSEDIVELCREQNPLRL